jgi:hypothetical protein
MHIERYLRRKICGLLTIPHLHLSRANHTSQLNSIVHHIIQLIKFALQPPIQHNLILIHKRCARRRQHLCALLEVVNVVDTKHRKACVRFRIILIHNQSRLQKAVLINSTRDEGKHTSFQ